MLRKRAAMVKMREDWYGRGAQRCVEWYEDQGPSRALPWWRKPVGAKGGASGGSSRNIARPAIKGQSVVPLPHKGSLAALNREDFPHPPCDDCGERMNYVWDEATGTISHRVCTGCGSRWTMGHEARTTAMELAREREFIFGSED